MIAPLTSINHQQDVSSRRLYLPPERHLSDRWRTIVQEHAASVVGAAWRILGNTADAEDVAQEVFFEAFRKWDDRADLKWINLLKRLAVCRALDRARLRKPATSSVVMTEIASNASGPVEIAAASELTELLRQAIDSLPRREAEVFCLCYFEDQGHAEIAAILGMKPGAVATALCKARAKLEKLLGPVFEGDRL
jgi:RNA polymerase sigma-70 factor, ECF subfamily